MVFSGVPHKCLRMSGVVQLEAVWEPLHCCDLAVSTASLLAYWTFSLVFVFSYQRSKMVSFDCEVDTSITWEDHLKEGLSRSDWSLRGLFRLLKEDAAHCGWHHSLCMSRGDEMSSSAHSLNYLWPWLWMLLPCLPSNEGFHSEL